MEFRKGIGFEKVFEERFKKFRLMRLLNDCGKGLFRLFCVRVRFLRWIRILKLRGRGFESEYLERFSDFKFVRLLNYFGILFLNVIWEVLKI